MEQSPLSYQQLYSLVLFQSGMLAFPFSSSFSDSQVYLRAPPSDVFSIFLYLQTPFPFKHISREICREPSCRTALLQYPEVWHKSLYLLAGFGAVLAHKRISHVEGGQREREIAGAAGK